MAGEIYNATGGGGTGLSLGRVGGYPANFTFTPDNVSAFLADLQQQLADAVAKAKAALAAQPNTQSHDWLENTLLASRIGKQIRQLTAGVLPATTDSAGFLQVSTDGTVGAAAGGYGSTSPASSAAASSTTSALSALAAQWNVPVWLVVVVVVVLAWRLLRAFKKHRGGT